MAELDQEDLFDIEQRPGAGVRLWGRAVELQLERVVEVNFRHRKNHEPGVEADPDAIATETQLHMDVYFLALAIRRVLLFHDAFAAQVADQRLDAARERFLRAASSAKDFRDFLEHLDQYLLGRGRRQVAGDVPERVSPVLELRWDADNVRMRFGDAIMDITLAAHAARNLAQTTGEIWREYIDQSRPPATEEPLDDDVTRYLQVTTSVSTLIGGQDEGYQVTTGFLRDVRVTEESLPD